ncbi:MAG: hypothetical protein DCF29_23015 [Alphaproteobacteria bacterium]|nr:MAG: hypothetical protein DCF29_23015 [Alphaproteobacteria bacterium]
MPVIYRCLAFGLLLGASACASTNTGAYQETDLKTFTEQCEARDGLLAPTGQQSGRPQIDYVCAIRNAGRRVPSN